MTSAVVLEHPGLLPGSLGAAAPRQQRRTARDWLVDSFCFLVSLGWVILATFDAASPSPALAEQLPYDWMIVGEALLGLVCTLALWFRRRWPLGLALVTLPLAMFSVTSVAAVLIIYFTVVVHRRAAVALAVTAAGLFTNLFFALLRPEPGNPYWVSTVWGMVITLLVLAWGLFVRARRQLVLSLRERAERAEAEQQLRVAQARQLERTRIAREMHDVLAHRISLLSLHAGALEFRPDAPASEVARAAGVIRDSAHAALQDLREVIGVLRAEVLLPEDPERPQPTLGDLPALVAESRTAGIRVDLRDQVSAPDRLPVAVGRSVYRIVQEGLTNARKHASGAAVTVGLSGAPGDGLSVEIRNRWPVGESTGVPIPGTGTGLVGIAERVNLAGGRLEHGRDEHGDFRLAAWLPWPAP
ncbi:Signal transduction histidine kinase [Micromonospora phaseoli]|uniref:histidine kinase n=1 Tax=Micromonospora phaseoli TaxID=1144548 RepID=A0A1H7CRF1_9ACTN|nr:histidine kinase [Micromonospora phaseoli]PZV91579.1 signal transduction histidine kinase [Micromonospora phaseoli]GIJ80761.1 two-component sensor histidine kinase [Micromonospora phaseoli]SEJ92209.1 Signal transduction histidine kinase [Micromonospora phaseoli]